MNLKLTLAVSAIALSIVAHAQVIDPFYSGSYSFVNLGSAPGVPANYGGITLNASDPNQLLLGGAANGSAGAVYSVDVVRQLVDGKMRINAMGASSTVLSTAPFIDGGLTYAPNGSLVYTGFSNNVIGEIKPGSTSPDRITDLSQFGITASTGSLMFVPSGLPGAGQLKVLSYSASRWYTLPYAIDSFGLLTFGPASDAIQLTGGLEGVVYVPGGSALFDNPSILVSEYGTGIVASYEVDANGDPIVGSRRIFMSGLTGAEGAMIDPSTGDFLFSTFGGTNKVISVRGFATVPEPASLTVLGLGALAALRRKKRK